MKIGLVAILFPGWTLINIMFNSEIQIVAAIALFLILMVVIYWRRSYQRNQIFTPKVKSHVKDLGFDITAERPPDFTESIKYGVKISPGDINGISIDFFRYQSVNQRVFTVTKIDSKNEYELCSEITTRWNNSIYFEVLEKKRISW